MENQPQYSALGSLLNIEKVSTFERTSPWKNAEIAFTWTNFDYHFFHTHEYWETMIMIEGKINHFIDKKRYTLSVGDAWIVKPTDEHKLCSAGGQVRLLNFVIRKEYMQKLFEVYGLKNAENFSPENFFFSLKEATLRHATTKPYSYSRKKTFPKRKKKCAVKFCSTKYLRSL